MNLPDLSGTPWRAIVLSEKHGVWTLVSAERYEWLRPWRWNISWGHGTQWLHYAKRNVGPSRATVRMHREIMQLIDPKPPDEVAALHVDHINRCSLDNRDENLRWATPKANNNNRIARERGPSLDAIVAQLLAPYQAKVRELEEIPF